MSNTFEPRTSDFLDEDLYFIFDDENVVYDTYNKGSGVYISSDLEWPCLDSDDPEQEEIPTTQPKKKKKIKKSHRSLPRDCGYPEFTASTIKALSVFTDDLEDDDEFLPHMQNFKTAEIKEVPLISSKHKDYRRFRYYDLIRSKLGMENNTCSTKEQEQQEGHGKVHFNMQIDILEFDSEEILKQENPAEQIPFTPSSILLGKRKSGVLPTKLFFSFIEETHALELQDLLQETYDRFSWEIPMDYQLLHSVMEQAKHQSVAATENILRAFESVSTMGKHLMGVVNRLQASSMRFFVLSEAEIFIHEPLLRECLVDCEELLQNILLFKKVVKQSEEHMATKSCHISEGTRGSMYCLKKVKELFAMIYEKDHASWRYLQTVISLNDTYTRCVNFLNEMTPERVFRFLKHDFAKMLHDISNMDYLCGLLLDQIRKSLADSYGTFV